MTETPGFGSGTVAGLFSALSSSSVPGPTLLHEHPNRVAMAPPFELCESCRSREGKLIDSRWDAPAFLVCTRCHG